MTPDEQLMADIRAKYGQFIDAAVKGTPFPASLLAALVANETGTNDAATRVEPAVLAQLAYLVTGRSARFGAILPGALVKWINPPGANRPLEAIFLSLQNLATSWGPTQIMGYQAMAGEFALSELTNLRTHFFHAVAMLEDFKKRFNMLLPANGVAGDYFRCWNAGSPTGKTFDPDYAPNGLTRMLLYEQGSNPA
jgi:hypothetical protein